MAEGGNPSADAISDACVGETLSRRLVDRRTLSSLTPLSPNGQTEVQPPQRDGPVPSSV